MPSLLQYVLDAVRRPRQELTRRQQQLRYAFELFAHCWRVMQQHRAEGMAAELTYRTIFALIPLAVLGLVIFNVIGGVEDVRGRIENQLYAFFGVPDVAYETDAGLITEPENDGGAGDRFEAEAAADSDSSPAPEGGGEPDAESGTPDEQAMAAEEPPEDGGTGAAETAETAETEAEENRQAAASIRLILSDMVAKVASLDFASIGIVGLLLFIYAALSLTDSVEHVFNTIFSAPNERPIHLRLAIHWSLITLGSGLLGVSLYLSGQFVDYIAGTSLGKGWGIYLNHLAGIFASWILLFLLYALMPNTKVSVRAALIGALVAAVLWETAKFGFQVYVRTALPYSALYGSLGLIPLFLFWIYITWFIYLFGLVWTLSLQTMRGRIPSKAEDEAAAVAAGDPIWAIPIMVEIGRAFEAGQPVSRGDLADQLGLPGRSVRELCETLARGNLLHHAGDDQGEVWLLARPTDKITVAQILDQNPYRRGQATDHPAWNCLALFDLQRREYAESTTLETLIENVQSPAAKSPPAATDKSGKQAFDAPSGESR